ncbi:MAG: DUF499 domain-containing protein [Clostridiales bacterium]|jgi:hypothetical protein|nr:DUF499 domain-containing protein [Clostridiales bacterium]
MQTIAKLCEPRKNVFDDTSRDDVLNLSDFIQGKIDPTKFFDENFTTKGMEILLETAFKRFSGKSDTGVIKLTQAMGGGKTHNMLALALLAQNPELRKQMVNGNFDNIGEITVVAFSGRESDAKFGVWGSIAEQLGKREFFASYYSPLQAPGESAWVNLLKGKKVLILLDELPPYLVDAKSKLIGNSDLCNVTVTALSNLFTAIGKGELAKVCLVFSDLRATYESGSVLLSESFKELESEANRVALNLEPVALNSDEVYDILRKRLFVRYPKAGSSEVNEIAMAYKEAVVKAGKSGLTGYQGESVYLGIKDSYPFHPCIKELYARFKENSGFQQTRGLIRLMRQVVRDFYESGKADKQNVINVFDVNLNERAMISLIKQIKPSLDSAIDHDIANGNKGVAEEIDFHNSEKKEQYAQSVAKLLLMSSLNATPNGILGLSSSDLLGFLCKPDTDLNVYKKALDELLNKCWYLKTDSRGRMYFQDTKNLIADMNERVQMCTIVDTIKELKKILGATFEPRIKKCYEKLFVLPAIDEIHIEQGKLSLVISEPHAGSGLHPDLLKFYENCPYKNRVMFLSGQYNIMEKLYDNVNRFKAISDIMNNMRKEHVPETDQQYKEGESLFDKNSAALLSTIREAFITLYYPVKSGSSTVLSNVNIKFEFVANKCNGEEQIVKALTEEMKFEDLKTDERTLDALRRKCEARIFTQKEMPWSQILERAATEVQWQWYHPRQLEELRAKSLKCDAWREVGGYIVKGPFQKEPTEVVVVQDDYDFQTAVFKLKVKPVRGDTVYYDFGAVPTKASNIAPATLNLKEPTANFLCIDNADSDNPHPTGKMLTWKGKVSLKRDQRQNANGNQTLELKTHPDFEIRYTTDGSNPKESGGLYSGEIILQPGCKYVKTAVYYNDDLISEEDIPIIAAPQGKKLLAIKDDKPLEYTLNTQKKCGDTRLAYAEFAKMEQLPGTRVHKFTVVISEKSNSENYMEIQAVQVPWDVNNLRSMVDLIRDKAFAAKDVEVEFSYKIILFETGAAFKRWIEINKINANELEKEGAIKQ